MYLYRDDVTKFQSISMNDLTPVDPRNLQMYLVDFGNGRVEMYRSYPAARARVLDAIMGGERPTIRLLGPTTPPKAERPRVKYSP